jgi:hypothetical protein
MDQVKLLSMTGLLTILVWAGADSLVNEVVSIRVSIQVDSASNPDMLVEVDPDTGSRWIDVQVSGPRKATAELREHEPLAAHLRLEEKPTGTHTILLDREMLKRALREQWKAFDRMTVLSAEPPTIAVIVDHLITRELDITLNRLTLTYDQEPKPDHLFTTLVARESHLESLPNSDPDARIDISGDAEKQLRDKPRGQPATVTVLLDGRRYGPGAELSPDRISVEAVVKADRSEARIPTVPIKLVLSFANLPRAVRSVARDGTPLTLVTQTIEVAGPVDSVNRLVTGETRAYGFIQLKQADLDQLDVVKAWMPEFRLPPGITLSQPPKPVEFKLQELGAVNPPE